MHSDLRQLRQIPVAELANFEHRPKLVIKSDDDVEFWKSTQSYLDYAIFLRRLNESVVGCSFPWLPEHPSQAAVRMISLLDSLDHWIDEIPPLETPQRFGNLAFRAWGKRVEERADDLLHSLLPREFSAAIPFVKPYLVISFGSFTRLDYGTGHELGFALFLLCLTLIRFFEPVQEQEREMVLCVFLRYIRLCWRLQDVYRLEPAGSQGVWGLDDHSFLPYIFGSGQLRDQREIPVSSVVKPPLPLTNFYFMAIMRIHELKYGPFHEHSSQLHSIAVGVPNWSKVNIGLFKMYEAEVLGKRVVVQHIPLGGLLEWSADRSASDNPISSTSQGTNGQKRTTWEPLPRPAVSGASRLESHIPTQTPRDTSSTEFVTSS